MATFSTINPSTVADECATRFEGWHHSSVLANGKTVAAVISVEKLRQSDHCSRAMAKWVCIDTLNDNPYNNLLRALWAMTCERLVGPARIRVRGSTPFCVTTVCDVERFIQAKPRLAGIVNIASDMINSAHRKRAAAVRYGGSQAYRAPPFPKGITPSMAPSSVLEDDVVMQQLAHIVKLTDDIELHGSKQNTRQPRGRGALAELLQTRATAIAALVHNLTV